MNGKIVNAPRRCWRKLAIATAAASAPGAHQRRSSPTLRRLALSSVDVALPPPLRRREREGLTGWQRRTTISPSRRPPNPCRHNGHYCPSSSRTSPSGSRRGRVVSIGILRRRFPAAATIALGTVETMADVPVSPIPLSFRQIADFSGLSAQARASRTDDVRAVQGRAPP
jgi:hypothetical protein